MYVFIKQKADFNEYLIAVKWMSLRSTPCGIPIFLRFFVKNGIDDSGQKYPQTLRPIACAQRS